MDKTIPNENLNCSHIYRYYRGTVEKPIGRDVFNNILSAFLLFIKELILEGHSVRLPSGLGVLSILGRRIVPQVDEAGEIKGLSVNWDETRKLWRENEQAAKEGKRIYHFNDHSDNIRYHIHWNKASILIENKHFYTYKSPKDFRHQIAAKVKKENKQYLITGEGVSTFDTQYEG